uniref:Uncharacterized protein n=1 Tax=Oryza barthii TaxID=65489 RepID=A0A0D3EYR9_9ORYZ
MGNGLSPCMHLPATAAAGVKLVYWGGQTRMLDDDGGVCAVAGDVTAELPGDHVVCAADSFYVGLPIPVVSAGEELASLSPAPSKKVSVAGPGQCPFEYVKGEGGATLIRVLPEFIEKVISCDENGGGAVQHAGAEAALRAADGAEEPAVVAEAGDDLGVQQD